MLFIKPLQWNQRIRNNSHGGRLRLPILRHFSKMNRKLGIGVDDIYLHEIERLSKDAIKYASLSSLLSIWSVLVLAS